MYPHEAKDIHSKNHEYVAPTPAAAPNAAPGYQEKEYTHQEFPKHVTGTGVHKDKTFECADAAQEQNVKEGREPQENAPEPEPEKTA